MERFKYRALDARGQQLSGQLEAASEAEAARQLLRQGLKPLELSGSAPQAAASGVGGRRAITVQDRVVALQELATLLKAGVALDEALDSLATGHAASGIGRAMVTTLGAVRAGQSLHDALAGSGLGLAPYLMTLVRVGEASGRLGDALQDAAAQLEFQRRTAQELRNALIYPTVLVVAGVLAVLIIFLGVIPKFAPLLKNTRGQVPEFSVWVIQSSLFLKTHLLAVGLGAGAVLGGAVAMLSRAQVRARLMDRLALAPVVGPWLRDAEVGRWALLIGTMLRNRVPLLEALRLSRGSASLTEFSLLIGSAVRELENGRSLYDALRQSPWIPAARLNLIKVGERSGTLDAMLISLGTMQSESARERQKQAMSLIEPAAILIIGAVIGVLMISVMMAITSMNSGAV
jgi:general secretion pathway protein F